MTAGPDAGQGEKGMRLVAHASQHEAWLGRLPTTFPLTT
jgi:hypothetical protein